MTGSRTAVSELVADVDQRLTCAPGTPGSAFG